MFRSGTPEQPPSETEVRTAVERILLRRSRPARRPSGSECSHSPTGTAGTTASDAYAWKLSSSELSLPLSSTRWRPKEFSSTATPEAILWARSACPDQRTGDPRGAVRHRLSKNDGGWLSTSGLTAQSEPRKTSERCHRKHHCR